MRKPFDEFAERPILHNSRGDKTAIELFLTVSLGWEADVRRRFKEGKCHSD
jgi:hypothetical protein